MEVGADGMEVGADGMGVGADVMEVGADGMGVGADGTGIARAVATGQGGVCQVATTPTARGSLRRPLRFARVCKIYCETQRSAPPAAGGRSPPPVGPVAFVQVPDRSCLREGGMELDTESAR
eukprot:9478782-Pyramimonas_sp.AAC.1